MLVEMDSPVCYYYKHPITGIGMNFIKNRYGWCVSFPNADRDVILDINLADIPYPKLTDEEQREVDSNYEQLHERMGRL